MTEYDILRQQLQKARADAGLTQSQLAQLLDKTQSYVSKIESGERQIDIIEFMRWCECCGANAVTVLRKVLPPAAKK
ncbi:helix-turn-helix transcriptional regulator [Herbaspirillum lusitanum]|jgi:transcriptional regulator with XRE-family HTH domain|uniref:Helix-turn-helix transcriptional regulator n=1 Tax=Herbaspirillum lusitanum TaxID=213312 RepID=A0ABW9A2T0_9BURK